jgi:hypothetical protein
MAEAIGSATQANAPGKEKINFLAGHLQVDASHHESRIVVL